MKAEEKTPLWKNGVKMDKHIGKQRWIVYNIHRLIFLHVDTFLYGGCSSEVEHLIVAQEVEIAKFSIHPIPSE